MEKASEAWNNSPRQKASFGSFGFSPRQIASVSSPRAIPSVGPSGKKPVSVNDGPPEPWARQMVADSVTKLSASCCKQPLQADNLVKDLMPSGSSSHKSDSSGSEESVPLDKKSLCWRPVEDYTSVLLPTSKKDADFKFNSAIMPHSKRNAAPKGAGDPLTITGPLFVSPDAVPLLVPEHIAHPMRLRSHTRTLKSSQLEVKTPIIKKKN